MSSMAARGLESTRRQEGESMHERIPTERNERLKRALERRRRNESKVIPMTADRLVAVGPMELAPREEVYGPEPRKEGGSDA